MERVVGDSPGQDRCGGFPSWAGLSVYEGECQGPFPRTGFPRRSTQHGPSSYYQGAACKRPFLGALFLPEGQRLAVGSAE